MLFKYCVIGESCYEYNKEKGKVNTKLTVDADKARVRIELDLNMIGSDYFNFLIKNQQTNFDQNFRPMTILSKGGKQYEIANQNKLIQEYWKIITTCHECIIEEKEDGTILYSV